MYSQETRYVNGHVDKTDEGRDRLMIHIDQFNFYRGAMDGYLSGEKVRRALRFSAVRFDLPQYPAGSGLVRPFVWALGDGEGWVSVITQGVVPQRAFDAGQIKEGNRYWKIFETTGFELGKRPKVDGVKQMPYRVIEDDLATTFTTNLSPLVYGDRSWPFEGVRQFLLNLDLPGTYLEVNADRHGNKIDSNIVINYLADQRDWESYEVSTIKKVDGMWVAGKAPRKPHQATD